MLVWFNFFKQNISYVSKVNYFRTPMSFDITQPEKFPSFTEEKSNFYNNPQGCLPTLNSFIDRVEDKKDLRAFIRTYEQEARNKGTIINKKIVKKEEGSLAGMVVGIKDLFCYKDHPLGASSKILQGFVSQITATSVERLLQQDAIILGHQNCDEFGMGSSNEHSIYGSVGHPLDNRFTAGGSSGGGAAAISAGMCHVSLGTDTGGSIRQPASLCGVVGFKPTYGRISRYGIIAHASSLDTVSILSNDIADCAEILKYMAGEDNKDHTCSTKPVPPYSKLLEYKKSAKIAYLKEAFEHPALNKEVRVKSNLFIENLKKAGNSVTNIEFPLLKYALPTYYVLSTAEASSNLACYDGVRYGYRSSSTSSIEELYVKSRTEGFGTHVKKRILLGTFVLSSSYYEAYYKKAQQVAQRIKQYLTDILEQHDFICLPTTPNTAFKKGVVKKDGMQESLGDLYTVLASLAGLPAISIPNGVNKDGWPIGIQLIGKSFKEEELLAFSDLLIKENISKRY